MAGAPGFEPGFSRSKRDVLPLDEAPSAGGPGGDRTLAVRLKADAPPVELTIHGAPGRNRTGTTFGHRVLSAARLPISPQAQGVWWAGEGGSRVLLPKLVYRNQPGKWCGRQDSNLQFAELRSLLGEIVDLETRFPSDRYNQPFGASATMYRRSMTCVAFSADPTDNVFGPRLPFSPRPHDSTKWSLPPDSNRDVRKDTAF